MDNSRNLCDWCSTCDEKNKSFTNCMSVCGAPLDILTTIENERNAKADLQIEVCRNCKYFHRLKKNFVRGVGFEESFACDVFLHMDEAENGFIQEVNENDRCELWEGLNENKSEVKL